MNHSFSGLTRYRGWFLTLLCLGVFVVYLDSTIVNIALPNMQATFQFGMKEMQWVIDGYSLTFACLLLSAGTIGDILGHKKIFVAGMIGFTVFSALCGLSQTIEWLIIFRLLQGAFGSLLIPTSLAIIRHVFVEPTARAKAIGIWAGLGGLALAAGPLAGGWLVEKLGWESVFWINVPIGIAVIIIMLFVKRESARNRNKSLDVIGQLLFMFTVAALTYAMIEGHSLGWGSVPIVSLFAASACLLLLFLLWEARIKEPVFPLTLFRSSVFTMAILVNFLGFFGLFAVVFLMTFYFQNINGWSATEAGTRFLALNISIMVASFTGSALSNRIPPLVLIPAGMVLMGGSLLATLSMGADTSFFYYALALVGIGIGVSVAGSSATVALMSHVPLQWAGTASGITNTFRQVSGILGVALSGTFISAHLPRFDLGAKSGLSNIEGAELFVEGMHDTFLIAALGSLLAGAVSLAILARVHSLKAKHPQISKITES